MTRQITLLVLLLLVDVTATGCQKLAFWRQKPKHDAADRPTTSWMNGERLTPTQDQKRDFMLEMAAMFENQGETDQAIHAYEAVLEQKEIPLAYHRLGVLHVRKGGIDKGVMYFERAMDRGGENAELLCDLGYGLYLAQRYAEADTALQRAIELNPQLTRAHVNYGMLLARTGRFDDALYAFSRAGLPESEARNNLAFAMMLDKRFPEAQAQYEGALRANPQNESARRGLAALSRVQQNALVSDRSSSGATTVAQRPAAGEAPAAYFTR